jgi:signal transduction histidine kinase/pSer/pThr/pTyr-binding forkhead associated (FHA) protein
MVDNKPQNIQHLLVIEDDRGKRIIALQEETCSIGRDPSNTIVLYSPRISRQHAILLRTTNPEVDGYLFRIVDGNLQGNRSRNGLIVNGKKCFSHDLTYGDEIIFGEEVKARYYVSTNPSDIEFLVSCESGELSGFLQTMHNPFQTISASQRSSQELKDFNESSLVRLASYPELFSYPIIEVNLSGKIIYLNPAAVQEFPNIREESRKHPLIYGIVESICSNKDFYVRQVSVGHKVFEQSVHYFAESELIRSYIIEVTERKLAENALKKAYDNLEVRVEERTSELKTANENLQAEIIERQKAEEEVRFIQRMMQAISDSSNFQSALSVALQMVCEVTDLSYAEAWIPTDEGDLLQCGSFWHRNELPLKRLQQRRHSYTFAPNEGIPGRTWVSKQPELLKDLQGKADNLFLLDSLKSLKMGLSIPLIDKNQVVAVLVFLGYEACREDVRMINLISTVAVHIGSLMRRMQAEDALRSSHATNRALLTAIPDWMFRIKKNGEIVNFYDPKICPLPLLNIDFIGKCLSDVLSTDVAGLLMTCIQQALQTNEVQITEYQLHLDDRLVDYEARIAVSSNEEVMVIIRDITERKKSETEIRNALEREKELNELKSRFVSVASHEFRTPLSIMLSSAQLVEKYSHKWSEEKKVIHLQRIQTAVRHMTDLLNSVLLINKAEVGKIEFDPIPISLNCFCQEVVEDIQLTTNDHTVIFKDNSKCQIINADQKLLRHILTNLLSNAIKYSPNKENIYFDLDNTDSHVVFRVKDEGIGIPRMEQSGIFNSFNRASNVGTISGTGLGLSILKSFVDLHGGHIELDSEVGLGTTFTIRLPLKISV